MGHGTWDNWPIASIHELPWGLHVIHMGLSHVRSDRLQLFPFLYSWWFTVYHVLFPIQNLFQLLIDHEEAVAPDPSDPMHEILKELGPSPSVESLLGKLSFPLSFFFFLTCT